MTPCRCPKQWGTLSVLNSARSRSRLSADCQRSGAICWEMRSRPLDSWPRNWEMWLRGRDLNPRPLGYEPVQDSRPLQSEGDSRPNSLR